MNRMLAHIKLTWIILLSLHAIAQGQGSVDFKSKISNQVQLMRESKTADDIYTVRTRLENLSETAPKDLETTRAFRDAYLVMSEKLAAYDHYKSGCVAYFRYLELEDAYHAKYMAALRDSAGSISAPVATSKSEPKEPEPVKDELVVPTDTVVSDSIDVANQTSVTTSDDSGSNTIWIIILITLVIIFGALTFSQRKRLSRLNVALSGEQSEVKRLFRISATVSMISGVIRYAREFSAHCADVLMDMVDTMKGEEKTGKPIDDKTIAPAEEAISVFKKISSGGKSGNEGN